MIDDATPPPAIVRRLSDGGATPALGADHMIIANLPIASRPFATSTLGTAVASAVRETLDRNATVSPSPSDLLAGAHDDGAADTASLDEAVMTAHEQRIAVLRARIDEARTAGAAPRLLADMNRRLLRAEAARRIAAARANGDVMASALADMNLPTARRPAIAVALGSAPSQGHAIAPRAVTMSTAARLPWLAASAHHLPRMTTLAVHFPIGDAPLHRRLAGRRHVAGLVNVRRSLAAARHALGGGSRQPTRLTPHFLIASLWHWDGSSSWSLSAGRLGES